MKIGSTNGEWCLKHASLTYRRRNAKLQRRALHRQSTARFDFGGDRATAGGGVNGPSPLPFKRHVNALEKVTRHLQMGLKYRAVPRLIAAVSGSYEEATRVVSTPHRKPEVWLLNRARAVAICPRRAFNRVNRPSKPEQDGSSQTAIFGGNEAFWALVARCASTFLPPGDAANTLQKRKSSTIAT